MQKFNNLEHSPTDVSAMVQQLHAVFFPKKKAAAASPSREERMKAIQAQLRMKYAQKLNSK